MGMRNVEKHVFFKDANQLQENENKGERAHGTTFKILALG